MEGDKAGASSGENAAALEKKDAGNKAYQAKDYDLAIQCYGEAIALDPDNHVYYSNRSACYGAKGDWERSAQDAKACIEKDPGFIKGYYRLTLAQIEQKDYDGAMATIVAGLERDPNNPELQKQLRIAKAKKNYAEAAASRGGGKVGHISMEEIQEAQEQLRKAGRELAEVRGRAGATKADKRRNELTLGKVQEVPEATRLFKSIGKTFVLTPREAVVDGLRKKMEEQEQRATDLEARQSYLEAKVASHEAMLREAAAAIAQQQAAARASS